MANIYNSAPSAYDYPLLVKQLLNRAKTVSQDQEIVYADKKRLTYKELFNILPQKSPTSKVVG